MTTENDRFSSPTNPNGLFEHFLNGSLSERLPDQQDRLIAAVADIKSYLVGVVGVDVEMAEVVAARAVHEITLALETSLEAADIKEAINLGIELADRAAVDRAIDDIIG